MLKIRKLQASYGNTQALFGIDIFMKPGQVISLLGRNGMGKTTVIKAIMGLVTVTGGTITFEDSEIQNLASYETARLGFGLAPEGRQIFPNLTVKENLVVTAANYTKSDSPYTLKRVLEIFPRLAERLTNYGNQLSGGEQQMLSIARALMTNPKVLILDEATEGLSPLVRADIRQSITALKALGESIIVVDKNLKTLLNIADYHYILQNGVVVWAGSSTELANNSHVQTKFLGV